MMYYEMELIPITDGFAVFLGGCPFMHSSYDIRNLSFYGWQQLGGFSLCSSIPSLHLDVRECAIGLNHERNEHIFVFLSISRLAIMIHQPQFSSGDIIITRPENSFSLAYTGSVMLASFFASSYVYILLCACTLTANTHTKKLKKIFFIGLHNCKG